MAKLHQPLTQEEAHDLIRFGFGSKKGRITYRRFFLALADEDCEYHYDEQREARKAESKGGEGSDDERSSKLRAESKSGGGAAGAGGAEVKEGGGSGGTAGGAAAEEADDDLDADADWLK